MDQVSPVFPLHYLQISLPFWGLIFFLFIIISFDLVGFCKFQDFRMMRSQVPAFGSWDWNQDLPFTQCFESATQAGLLRYTSYSDEDRDLYVAGDLYENDVVTPAMIVVPRRRVNFKSIPFLFIHHLFFQVQILLQKCHIDYKILCCWWQIAEQKSSVKCERSKRAKLGGEWCEGATKPSSQAQAYPQACGWRLVQNITRDSLC